MPPSSSKNKPRLCIVSPYSYPLFNSACASVFGGWEIRTTLIAKELAKRNSFEVIVVVWDHGQPNIEQRDGVTLYSYAGQAPPLNIIADLVLPASANIPPIEKEKRVQQNNIQAVTKGRVKSIIPWQVWLPLRDLVWATRSASESLGEGIRYAFATVRGAAGLMFEGLRKAYKHLSETHGIIGDYIISKKSIALYDQINADIYLVPGAPAWAAEVAYYCRLRQRSYVFLAGSDPDYSPIAKDNPWQKDTYSLPGYLKLYAINQASLHIVQNEQQAQMLQQHYSRASVVIRNPIDLTLAYPPTDPLVQTILWVGRSDDNVKRPSLILDLAEKLPGYQFVIVLMPMDKATHLQCLERAQTLPNVTILGRVPYHQIEEHFAKAKLLANTSVFEGFPNTFLQASKYGIPIVSLNVDPGKMLSQHGCGVVCANNISIMEQEIQRLMSDTVSYNLHSANCIEYVRSYHSLEKIVPMYEEALQQQLRVAA